MVKSILAFIFTVNTTFVSAQEFARIIDSKINYVLQKDKSVRIEEVIKLTIHNDKGYEQSVFKEYSDKFRKIESVTIDVFNSKGEKIKRLKPSDGLQIGLSPTNEITDTKLLIIDPHYKEFPFTIVIAKKIRLDGFISLPTWIPRHEFNLAIDHAELTITYPETMKINFRNESITESKITKTDDNTIRHFEVNQLGSIDNKMRYQDFYNEQSKVYISPEHFWLDDKSGSTASWSDFGDWYYELNSETYNLKKSTKAFIDKLDKSNHEKLVKSIYQFMQDNTRYISIQLGIGGFKSTPTETVEKYGYGDCKALSTYMKNMLDYAGISSNYVLVRAGPDVPEVLADFPSNQFNHVYIGVPMMRDTLYLECTSQELPFNYTGTFTDDRNVLWINKSNSKIIRSTIYTHKNNTQNTTTIINLDSLGNAEININMNKNGVFFDELMIYKSAPKDYLMKYNQGKFNFNDFTISEFKYHQADRSTASFNTNYTLHVKGFAQKAGNKLIVPTISASPIYTYFQMDDLMKYCSIKRGVNIKDEFTINLPSNYWAYQLSEPEQIESNYGRYTIELHLEGNMLTVKREYTLYKGDYTKKQYEEFKQFYNVINKIENKKLVLNSKT